MNKKNGAPIIDVIMPTGILLPLPIVLANISAIIKSIDPHKILAGINILWLWPKIFLAICGQTSPTKPIIPRCDTTLAQIREASSKDISLNLSTFTPCVFATSSPDSIELYLLAIKKKNTIDTTNMVVMIKSIFKLALDKSPKDQIIAADKDTSDE